MTILVLGINHKTASVSLREKVAFSDEKRQQALQQIEQSALADSAVILSTCNRTEVYFHNKAISPQDDAQWQRQCIDWLSEMQHIDKEELNHSLYVKQNQFATQHLMRVACGLDSLVLGEPQILGQVKQAYQLSEDYYQQHQGAISGQLSRLFQKLFLRRNGCEQKPVLVKMRSLWLIRLVLWLAKFLIAYASLIFC